MAVISQGPGATTRAPAAREPTNPASARISARCVPPARPAARAPRANYNQVMSAAVVGPLTDDNCDGKYDERDIPAIVFNSYAGEAYTSDGILRAVTGRGKRLWDATDATARTVPGASIAIGELDA